MAEAVEKVLYETRIHASRPYVPTYPPLAQSDNKSAKGGLSWFLSVRGINQLKEKWNDYRHPRKTNKPIGLYVSPGGERVAVTSRNHVTIFRKEDDYKEPFGTFTSRSSGSFTSGAWPESHDVLGLADDDGTLFFIKINGEEIARVTKRHLKVSSSILGLIKENTAKQKSCLCNITVLTSDGRLHLIEISREPSASISSRNISSAVKVKRQFPDKVFCYDYNPDHSLLAIVGNAVGTSISTSGTSGSVYLSVWRRCQNSDLELLFSTQIEGFDIESKGDQVAYPKVVISPQGTYATVLDVMGCLHIFELDKERHSVLQFGRKEEADSKIVGHSLEGWRDILRDVVDFTWWSRHILAIVKRRGNLSMFDILRCLELQEDDTVYSMPIVERAQNTEGNLFLLESSSLPFDCDRGRHELGHIEHANEGISNQCENPVMWWRLLSLLEKSIPEMYNILIRNQKYQAALSFANCHGLDKDDVLKAKWIHSDPGVNEVNTILANIKDQSFVLSECIGRVGPTEDSVKALLAFGLHLTNCYKFTDLEDQESDQLWEFRMVRLKLLQFSDMLETYLGIKMGRFSTQEYSRFRVLPIKEAATSLAETGKIGALNLLFKRHPYSLAPFTMQVLTAIPETVPIQTYAQLLPGISPPSSTALREEDWVECDRMINYINKLPENHEINTQIRTELIVRRCMGPVWPSSNELTVWYRNRAIDIDSCCGQLDNSLCLVELACGKGVYELQQFQEDVSYLHKIIYSDDNDEAFSMSLATWEQLSAYHKFKTMLEGVKEENVVKRLRDIAIQFMHDKSAVADDQEIDSFLVKWLKETAKRNKLDLCSAIIEEACGDYQSLDFQSNHFFKNEAEVIDCALQCIYLCTLTDRWNTMAAILSKLPQVQDAEFPIVGLEKRYKVAEGHVEAGRLLAFYLVPKAISFFLDVHSDEKGVKQILRLMLSKFVRRQPGRSDNDWACMWRDLLYLRDKAFPFLDLEYMLIEFCRGLLKAGKFSLARNYLRGTGSVPLPSEKSEVLVIQAAREYFFSASSLASEEIWKARECLNLFPSSRAVRAEADIIDAITVKLPNLGVTLLPMQFRQIKDPMEIIRMTITGQAGAYLHVDELINVAKLLGLNSFEDISYVQEAVAREAAVVGDLQVAFDLCVVLTKKGHGPIWDLCAAIARGPPLEQMDTSSRKQLLGFALAHSDEESIGELLHAWKDIDMLDQCETLAVTTGISPPGYNIQGSMMFSLPRYNGQDMEGLKDSSEMVDGTNDDKESQLNNIKATLLSVAKNMSVANGTDWESLLKENGKVLSFAALQLPWLLELSRNRDHDKEMMPDLVPGKQFVSVKTSVLITVLSWLARNGFAPKDDLIALLAKSIIEPPVTEEEDLMGCSFLLNLVDAFSAVEIIEEQLKTRETYKEIQSIMNLGMTYSLLHNCGVECAGPARRRELLWRNFKKNLAPHTDELGKIDKVQSTFWREWKLKLEENMRIANRSRVLEQIIPGVETARFLSGDVNYIENVIFSLIESVRLERKQILKDVLKLSDTYGLKRSEVILRYLSSILVSDIWTNEDIISEISEVREEILSFASETIETVSRFVYPAIDGCDKLRVAYIYGLLFDCYSYLEKSRESLPITQLDNQYGYSAESSRLYKTLEQECRRVSFVKDLNFKNIAGLGRLNLHSFSTEVYAHLDEFSLEALAKMVENLLAIFTDQVPEDLISWRDVYKRHIASLLDSLKGREDMNVESLENFHGFIGQLERIYDRCKTHMGLLEPFEALNIVKRFFTGIIPQRASDKNLPDDAIWQECLILLINFWIRLVEEMKEFITIDISIENLGFNPELTKACLKVLMRLVMDDSISPSQAWTAILGYINFVLNGDCAAEVFSFCRAMVFSGCGFRAISEVFSEAVSQCPFGSTSIAMPELQDLPHLYLSILEPILQNMASGSLENRNLYSLLSSLSNLEGDLEELEKVRHLLWGELANFSENLQLPSQARVYALELMQFISRRNIKGFPSELQSNVLPWEGWDGTLSTSKTGTTPDMGLLHKSDGSNRFASNLIALRSSHLAAAISPEAEITSDDLLNVETAVSCFVKLCATASTDPHLDALLAILKEWEGLFSTKKTEDLTSCDQSNPLDDWGNDEWDEGWESLQEVESPTGKEQRETVLLVHPLGSCWLEIFKKLIALSRSKDVLRLINLSLLKCNEVLIDKNGANSLCQELVEADSFLASKISLLLPYEEARLMCLSAVEDKLKQGGIPEATGSDHEFLLLLLYSGIISMIISKRSSYDSLFSYLCFIIGNLLRQFQETQVPRPNENNSLLLFKELLLPCFISELVKSDQHILAGFIVTKFMHTNPSLTLINVAEASLYTFLKRRLELLEDKNISVEEMGCETLKNVVLRLRDELGKSIRSALSVLSRSSR